MLLLSAALFAVGSAIERSKEGGGASVALAPGKRRVLARAPAVQPRREVGAEAARPSTPRTPERAGSPRAEATGEARSAIEARAGPAKGSAGSGRAASGEANVGESAAQLSRESRRAAASGSETGSRESASERLGERHREAKLLGINPEALSLLIIALIVSVLLAVVIWLRPRTIVLVATAGFGLLFAALDVREVLHQVDESRTGLIVIAGVLIGLHVLVAMLAVASLLGGRARTGATAA